MSNQEDYRPGDYIPRTGMEPGMIDKLFNTTFGVIQQPMWRVWRALKDDNIDVLSEKGLLDPALLPLFGVFFDNKNTVMADELFGDNGWAQFAGSVLTDPLSFATSALTAPAKAAKYASKALSGGASSRKLAKMAKKGQTQLKDSTRAIQQAAYYGAGKFENVAKMAKKNPSLSTLDDISKTTTLKDLRKGLDYGIASGRFYDEAGNALGKSLSPKELNDMRKLRKQLDGDWVNDDLLKDPLESFLAQRTKREMGVGLPILGDFYGMYTAPPKFLAKHGGWMKWYFNTVGAVYKTPLKIGLHLTDPVVQNVPALRKTVGLTQQMISHYKKGWQEGPVATAVVKYMAKGAASTITTSSGEVVDSTIGKNIYNNSWVTKDGVKTGVGQNEVVMSDHVDQLAKELLQKAEDNGITFMDEVIRRFGKEQTDVFLPREVRDLLSKRPKHLRTNEQVKAFKAELATFLSNRELSLISDTAADFDVDLMKVNHTLKDSLSYKRGKKHRAFFNKVFKNDLGLNGAEELNRMQRRLEAQHSQAIEAMSLRFYSQVEEVKKELNWSSEKVNKVFFSLLGSTVDPDEIHAFTSFLENGSTTLKQWADELNQFLGQRVNGELDFLKGVAADPMMEGTADMMKLVEALSIRRVRVPEEIFKAASPEDLDYLNVIHAGGKIAPEKEAELIKKYGLAPEKTLFTTIFGGHLDIGANRKWLDQDGDAVVHIPNTGNVLEMSFSSNIKYFNTNKSLQGTPLRAIDPTHLYGKSDGALAGVNAEMGILQSIRLKKDEIWEVLERNDVQDLSNGDVVREFLPYKTAEMFGDNVTKMDLVDAYHALRYDEEALIKLRAIIDDDYKIAVPDAATVAHRFKPTMQKQVKKLGVWEDGEDITLDNFISRSFGDEPADVLGLADLVSRIRARQGVLDRYVQLQGRILNSSPKDIPETFIQGFREDLTQLSSLIRAAVLKPMSVNKHGQRSYAAENLFKLLDSQRSATRRVALENNILPTGTTPLGYMPRIVSGKEFDVLQSTLNDIISANPGLKHMSPTLDKARRLRGFTTQDINDFYAAVKNETNAGNKGVASILEDLAETRKAMTGSDQFVKYTTDPAAALIAHHSRVQAALQERKWMEFIAKEGEKYGISQIRITDVIVGQATDAGGVTRKFASGGRATIVEKNIDGVADPVPVTSTPDVPTAAADALRGVRATNSGDTDFNLLVPENFWVRDDVPWEGATQARAALKSMYEDRVLNESGVLMIREAIRSNPALFNNMDLKDMPRKTGEMVLNIVQKGSKKELKSLQTEQATNFLGTLAVASMRGMDEAGEIAAAQASLIRGMGQEGFVDFVSKNFKVSVEDATRALNSSEDFLSIVAAHALTNKGGEHLKEMGLQKFFKAFKTMFKTMLDKVLKTVTGGKHEFMNEKTMKVIAKDLEDTVTGALRLSETSGEALVSTRARQAVADFVESSYRKSFQPILDARMQELGVADGFAGFAKLYGEDRSKTLMEALDFSRIAGALGVKGTKEVLSYLEEVSEMPRFTYEEGASLFGLNKLTHWTKSEQTKILQAFREGRLSKARTVKRYTVADVKKNPDSVYIFGDNLLGTGKGGQAVIRGQANAFGIPTKKKPTTGKDAYFTDDEFAENVEAIDAAFAKLPKGKQIVLPEDGLGTGRAKLEEKAPKTFAYLQDRLDELADPFEGFDEDMLMDEWMHEYLVNRQTRGRVAGGDATVSPIEGDLDIGPLGSFRPFNPHQTSWTGEENVLDFIVPRLSPEELVAAGFTDDWIRGGMPASKLDQDSLDLSERVYMPFSTVDSPERLAMRTELETKYPGLTEEGQRVKINTRGGDKVAKEYDRIVYGDHGPYIEFSPEQLNEKNLYVINKGPEAYYDVAIPIPGGIGPSGVVIKSKMGFVEGQAGAKNLKSNTNVKETINMVEQGLKTSTSRANKPNVKKGDIIEFTGFVPHRKVTRTDTGSTIDNFGQELRDDKGNLIRKPTYEGKKGVKPKTVLVRVTKAPYRTNKLSPEEWSAKEGWKAEGYDSYKDGWTYDFELVDTSSSPALYKQRKTVSDLPNPPKGEKAVQANRAEGYADYRVGKYYANPDEVSIGKVTSKVPAHGLEEFEEAGAKTIRPMKQGEGRTIWEEIQLEMAIREGRLDNLAGLRESKTFDKNFPSATVYAGELSAKGRPIGFKGKETVGQELAFGRYPGDAERAELGFEETFREAAGEYLDYQAKLEKATEKARQIYANKMAREYQGKVGRHLEKQQKVVKALDKIYEEQAVAQRMESLEWLADAKLSKEDLFRVAEAMGVKNVSLNSMGRLQQKLYKYLGKDRNDTLDAVNETFGGGMPPSELTKRLQGEQLDPFELAFLDGLTDPKVKELFDNGHLSNKAVKNIRPLTVDAVSNNFGKRSRLIKELVRNTTRALQVHKKSKSSDVLDYFDNVAIGLKNPVGGDATDVLQHGSNTVRNFLSDLRNGVEVSAGKAASRQEFDKLVAKAKKAANDQQAEFVSKFPDNLNFNRKTLEEMVKPEYGKKFHSYRENGYRPPKLEGPEPGVKTIDEVPEGTPSGKKLVLQNVEEPRVHENLPFTIKGETADGKIVNIPSSLFTGAEYSAVNLGKGMDIGSALRNSSNQGFKEVFSGDAFTSKQAANLIGNQVTIGPQGFNNAIQKQLKTETPAFLASMLKWYDSAHTILKYLATSARLPFDFHTANMISSMPQALMVDIGPINMLQGYLATARLITQDADTILGFDKMSSLIQSGKVGEKGRKTPFPKYISTLHGLGERARYMMGKPGEIVGQNEGLIFRAGGNAYDYNDIVKALVEEGALDTMIRADFVNIQNADTSLAHVRDMFADTTKAGITRKVDKAKRVAELSELFVRFSAMHGALHAGMDLRSAARAVADAMVDYSDLTQIERSALKRLSFFYTFPRKMVPKSLEYLFNNPARGGAMLNHMLTDKEEIKTSEGRVEVAIGDKRVNLGRLAPQVDAMVALASVADMFEPALGNLINTEDGPLYGAGRSRRITGYAPSDKPISPSPIAGIFGWQDILPTEDPLSGSIDWLEELTRAAWAIKWVAGEPLLDSKDPEVDYSPLELMARSVLPYRKVRPAQEEQQMVRRIERHKARFERELEEAVAEGAVTTANNLREVIQKMDLRQRELNAVINKANYKKEYGGKE